MLSSNTESGITVTYDTSNDNIDFAVDAAQTGITSLLATDIKIGEDDQTKIDFETADEIHFYAANAEQVYVADGVFGPQTDSDVDLGSNSVRWKDAYVDSVTSTGAISGTTGTFSGVVDVTDTTDASDATGDTGALRTEGGASIAKKLYVGTDLDVDGTANLDVVDIDGAVDMASTLAVGGDVTIASATSGKPELTIKNTNDDAQPTYLKFVKDTSTSAADNDEIAKIEFYHDDDGNNQTRYGAMIVSATDTATSSEDTKIRFMTRANATDTDTLALVSGQVGIGETAPLGTMHVKTSDSGVSSPDITDLVVETSGSGGISILTGTGGQGEIAFGDSGDPNIGRIAYNHGSNYLATVVNGSEVMRITSAGFVGIGPTSPNSFLHVEADDGEADNNYVCLFQNKETTDDMSKGVMIQAGSTATDWPLLIEDHDGSNTLMKLTGAGRLGLNVSAPNARLDINEGTSGQELIHLNHSASGVQTMLLFKTSSTTRGTIQSDNSPSQTAYNTSSDERLKENISEVNDALSIVNKIPVKQFNFIEDENNTPVIGYIGQELIKEYPLAVSVIKTDEYDDHSKMVAVLMKAVQELSAKVEALENA